MVLQGSHASASWRQPWGTCSAQGSVDVYGRQMHGCILSSAALGLFAGLQALSAASLF